MAAAALTLAVHVSPALASDRLDLVWRDASTHLVHVAGSTTTAFAPWASWGSWSEYTDIKFADVNGDGIDDLVGRYPGGSAIKVNLSTGSSFRWGGTWDAGNVRDEPWHLADVTGDGKADIVWRDPAANAIMVGVSTGTQFQAPVEWTKWWGAGELKFGDFNGDGRADIVSRPWGGGTIAVGLATQSLASGISYDGNVGSWNNGEPWHLADVNGDGHDDFISRVPAENSIKVMTVEGVKFAAPMEWTKWYGSMDIKVGDVNGDGRADIVGRGGGQTRVALARVSVGSGITYGGAWETGPDRSKPWYLAEVRAPVRSVSGDMDGNGVANATVTSTATTRTYWHSDSGPNSTSLLGDGYAWGNPTDYPLLGDFDGNGRQQLGLYRPGTPSSWYYATDGGTNSSDYLSSGLDLTLTGDIPLVGDFDGNDFDQIAVFRGGAFYFRKDVGPGSAGDDLINGGFRVGPNNEPINGIPLVGDFDDNGHDNFAVFDRSTGIVYWRDDWGPGGNGVRHTIDTGAALNDGNPDNDLDVPLVGDMDGNGTANLVMYRPTAGAFYWQQDGGSAAPGYAHSWWTIVGFDAEHWYNYIPLLQDFDGNRRDNAAVYRRYNGRFLWKGDWGPGSVDGEKYLASAADTDVPRASSWAARQLVLHQSSWRYGGVNGVVDSPDEAQRTVGEIRGSAEGFNGPYHGLSPSDRVYVRVWIDATWPTSRTFGGSNWKVDTDVEADAFVASFRAASSDSDANAVYFGLAPADRSYVDQRMREGLPATAGIRVVDGGYWNYAGGRLYAISSSPAATLLGKPLAGASLVTSQSIAGLATDGEIITTDNATSWRFGGANHIIDTQAEAAAVRTADAADSPASDYRVVDGVRGVDEVALVEAAMDAEGAAGDELAIDPSEGVRLGFKGPFYQTSDRPHMSHDVPGDVSAHAWWLVKNRADQKYIATVKLRLQQKKNGDWVNVTSWSSGDHKPGLFKGFDKEGYPRGNAGSNRRTNARVKCTTYPHTYAWRTEVDVDVHGIADTPWKMHREATLGCSAVGEGYGN